MPIRVFSVVIALGLGLSLAASGASAAPVPAVISAATPASSSTQVSIIAPLTVPSGSGGLISAETLTEYTAPLGLLTRQLDAVAGKPIAVALDPMIVASIRVLGTSAPATARSWLERLSLISNEIVPLPYANTDPTLATQSGQAKILEPISFDFALDPSNFVASDAPAPTASADPMDVGADIVPPYPSTEEVLAWNYSIDGFIWPRANSAVSSDPPVFLENGLSTLVLSSANVSRGAGAGSVATVDGMQALISDSTASSAMDEALGSTLGRDVSTAETALVAAVLTAGAAQSTPTASVLLTIDHSLELSSARLDTALASMTASPSITLVPLTTLASAPASPASVIDIPQPADRIADVDRLFLAAQGERSFFSIAADPDSLVAQRRLALLDVLATIPTDDPSVWLSAANGFLVDSRELSTSVAVVQSSNFLFLADKSFLPISVENNLNQAVTVFITVTPRTALLSVENSRVELQIEANSQAKGNIPVQALSNGVVDVEISLSSAAGLPIGSSSVSEVNVQAGWETPIVLTFGAIVVLIFAVGLVRSIIRRRKPEDD